MRFLSNWPRVIQLAWIVTDRDGNELSRAVHLIKPDGWTMPTDPFWTDHAFTQENSILNGRPIVEVLRDFVAALNHCEAIVSHNMSFDYNVVGAEMLRTGVRAGKILAKYCTKELTTDFCKIPHGDGNGYKWPKLSELYNILFGGQFENAHDALGDVIAVKDCFFELISRGVIKREVNKVTI